MKFSGKEYSAEEIRKFYRVSTDLVSRLERQYKCVRNVSDLFSVEMIVWRQQLHDACSQLLEADDADRYAKRCMDIVWKKIYYEVINTARQIKKASRWESEEKAMLWSHLVSGVGHYESLLVETLAELDLPFEQHLGWVSTPPSFTGRFSRDLGAEGGDNPKLIDRVCQCLIALGDLNRYLNELHSGSVGTKPPYSSMALRYYTAASKVDPKNGMPFNQIGMLLGAKGAALDAAYYYLRSMHASVPFEGAEGNFKMLVAKTVAQESGQEVAPVSLSKTSPLQAVISDFLVFVKCCVLCEEWKEDDLLKVARKVADGLERGSESVESATGDEFWVKLMIVLAACVKTFKDKKSNVWGVKAWLFFRVGETMIRRFLQELRSSMEPGRSWKFFESRLRSSGAPLLGMKRAGGAAEADIASLAEPLDALALEEDRVSDGGSEFSDDSADFVIESGDEDDADENQEAAVRSPGSRSQTDDKLSDSEFHTPQGVSPAPKSPTDDASSSASLAEKELARKSLLEALAEAKLYPGCKLLCDLLRWNLDLVRTCGAHLPSFWIAVADLVNVLCVCVDHSEGNVPADVEAIMKRRHVPDACGLFEEDDLYEGYAAMKPPPPDQFLDESFAEADAGKDEESETEFKKRLGKIKSDLSAQDKAILRAWAMRFLAKQLCRVDSTGMGHDEEKDVFYVEESFVTSSSPLAARGDTRDPIEKLCSELTKSFKMSILAQQYIKGQVADLGRKGRAGRSAAARLLPTPPYLVPDTAAMTDHLRAVRDLVRSGDFVLIMPRAVWLGLDKLKPKSRRARDAIRWLESLTLGAGGGDGEDDDGLHFRFQRAQEHERIEFVRRPKKAARDSWQILEVLECCRSVAQRGVAARHALIGRQYEDECQAWELSTVLFLVGGFDVAAADGGGVGTFLTVPGTTEAAEMTPLEVAHAVGVRMENVKDYHAKWRKQRHAGGER